MAVDATTATGQPNGAMPAPPDYRNLPYGEKKDLVDTAAGTPAAPPIDPQAQVMAEAQAATPPQQSLMRPTERPGEPVTAGLPVGPGSGPEALGQQTVPRVTRVLDALAQVSRNPALASLAAEAAARNL